MSTRRRKTHQELVMVRRLATSLRRTFQALESTQGGPWSPGPWWPEGHPKHRDGEEWLREEQRRRNEALHRARDAWHASR